MSNKLTCTDITNLTRGNGIRSGEGNAARTGGSVQIFEELLWVCFQMLKTRGKKDSPRRLPPAALTNGGDHPQPGLARLEDPEDPFTTLRNTTKVIVGIYLPSRPSFPHSRFRARKNGMSNVYFVIVRGKTQPESLASLVLPSRNMDTNNGGRVRTKTK